jgi:hypothetical protein
MLGESPGRLGPTDPASTPTAEYWVYVSAAPVAFGARTASLPPPLVAATRALLEQARPIAPIPPEPELLWVQSVPVNAMVEAVVAHDRFIVELPAERIRRERRAGPRGGIPLLMVQVLAPPIRGPKRVELSLPLPSAAVGIRGEA